MSTIRLEVGASPIHGLKLVRPRGKGGFAEVWEAIGKDGLSVAVKFMPSRNATSSAKELRAIQAIQKLNHDHLMKTRNVWSIPGYIVVEMDLADGSLFELYQACQDHYGCPMSAEMVIPYLKQAASALDFLNGRRHLHEGRLVGFQHCDVKPSNFLLSGDRLQLADFGLCLPLAIPQITSERWGTMEYASPEIHRGLVHDRTDQYALAITYFYLRTGKFPFAKIPTSFDRSYKPPPPDLSTLTTEEASVLLRSLDPDPLGRWPHCTHLINALERATPKAPGLSTMSGNQTS